MDYLKRPTGFFSSLRDKANQAKIHGYDLDEQLGLIKNFINNDLTLALTDLKGRVFGGKAGSAGYILTNIGDTTTEWKSPVDVIPDFSLSWQKLKPFTKSVGVITNSDQGLSVLSPLSTHDVLLSDDDVLQWGKVSGQHIAPASLERNNFKSAFISAAHFDINSLSAIAPQELDLIPGSRIALNAVTEAKMRTAAFKERHCTFLRPRWTISNSDQIINETVTLTQCYDDNLTVTELKVGGNAKFNFWNGFDSSEGLIPFESFALTTGTVYTAGQSFLRLAPDNINAQFSSLKVLKNVLLCDANMFFIDKWDWRPSHLKVVARWNFASWLHDLAAQIKAYEDNNPNALWDPNVYPHASV